MCHFDSGGFAVLTPNPLSKDGEGAFIALPHTWGRGQGMGRIAGVRAYVIARSGATWQSP